MSQDLQDNLHEVLTKNGFEHFGWAALSPALSLAHYESWLAHGYNGEMTYLERHLPMKKDPEKWLMSRMPSKFGSANSAIAVAVPYKIGNRPESLKSLTIAKYARGEDYHIWLHNRLTTAVADLKKQFPNDEFLVATDSQPILERDLAYRAGLGWFGKNTCLIDQRRGSLFLLGEIVTTLRAPIAGVPHPDRCGNCRRCIDACPTQAIVAPRVIDARKCISYWTIESKSVPPPELREKFGAHFFGCDICQDVCPWNQKVITSMPQERDVTEQTDDRANLIDELRWVLESSSSLLEKQLERTPLSRARGFGLKRNAMIVCANLKLTELRELISRYVTDSRLGELASWALHEIDC